MLRETAVLEDEVDEEGFPGLSERGDEGTVEDRRELVLWCPNVGRVEATRYNKLDIIPSTNIFYSLASVVVLPLSPSQRSL